MEIKRTASAHWEGTVKEGKGRISTQSGVLSNAQYGFSSRFESGIGTNPEELIGAAHAGCFSMQLSANLTKAGFPPESIDTKSTILFENGTITEAILDTTVKAPGITQEKFDEVAADAKQNCPISKLLNTKISLVSKLV
jgi:osmotically inducible protein OsmC